MFLSLLLPDCTQTNSVTRDNRGFLICCVCLLSAGITGAHSLLGAGDNPGLHACPARMLPADFTHAQQGFYQLHGILRPPLLPFSHALHHPKIFVAIAICSSETLSFFVSQVFREGYLGTCRTFKDELYPGTVSHSKSCSRLLSVAVTKTPGKGKG